MSASGKPLLLIQARNLITNLALPGFLTDRDGGLLFFNDAAAEFLGQGFEEVGPLPRERWARRFGPFNEDGCPLAADNHPFARSLRDGRPAQGRFRLALGTDKPEQVELSAIPLLHPGHFEGALIVFWPVEDAGPKD